MQRMKCLRWNRLTRKDCQYEHSGAGYIDTLPASNFKYMHECNNWR